MTMNQQFLESQQLSLKTNQQHKRIIRSLEIILKALLVVKCKRICIQELEIKTQIRKNERQVLVFSLQSFLLSYNTPWPHTQVVQKKGRKYNFMSDVFYEQSLNEANSYGYKTYLMKV